jgi:hypothetical protein
VLSTTTVSSKTRQTRNQILIRCSDMLNIRWKPSENLLGFDGYIFKAGVYYTGVPYSYTDELCDAQAFEDASTSKYFYKNVVIKNVPQPYYGSDCSGFVTLAWQLPVRYDTATFISGIQIGIFANVGAYDTASPGISDLEKAYAKLQPGDAVVMRDGSHGHTYIIAANEPTLPTPRVFAYEQTPPYVQFTSHTYAEMAAHGFLPFTLKSLK